jgi:hypothetical protein
MTYDFRLIKSEHGMGSFLDPPNSPQMQYEVIGWYSAHRTREPDCMMSLESALKDDDIPEGMKRRIRKLYEDADMQPTEEWLEQVYGYFKNCYSPDGEDRNVSNCLIVSPNIQTVWVGGGENWKQIGFGYTLGTFGKDGWMMEKPDPNTSLAVLHIRKFFPDHAIREDLLDAGRWGN